MALTKVTGQGLETLSDGVTITVDDNSDTLTIKSTDTDANEGPILKLLRDGDSAADGDIVGVIKFNAARDDNNSDISYGKILMFLRDASDGSEDGALQIIHRLAGSDVVALEIDNDEYVFNNGSNDVDFRVEGNGEANLFVVDAGNDKIGIGTTSPSCILHASTGSSGSGLIDVARFENEGTSANDGARIQLTAGSSTSGAGIGCLGDALNSAHLVFHAGGNTERMRLTSSGHLLVGSTTNVAANAKIFAKGSGVGIAVGYGTGSSEYRHLYMNSGDGSLYFFNNTNYANLSASGAWTNASDRRIKKNIVDIKYGLEDVLKIQPRSYQMKEVSGDHIGLIAQEVEEIIPEVVSGDPEKQLCLNYGSLVAVAFKAIQEQQTVIESLKTRITALEAE